MIDIATNSLSFELKRWSAWLPEQSSDACSNYWPNGRNLALTSSTPDLSFLTQMQRRRLTPLARAAIATAWDCWQTDEQLPTIFCSTHGETDHCFNILNMLAQNQDISPTQFTLSVHSGIAAMFSILTNNHAPYIAMASPDANQTNALLEAHGLLTDSENEVLVVFYDQPIPEVYQSSTPTPLRLTALALRLGQLKSVSCNDHLSVVRSPSEGVGKTGNEACGQSLENLIQKICKGQTSIKLGEFCWNLNLAK